MASAEGRNTKYAGFTTGGDARVHAGDNYNNHTVNTYNYTLRQRRSDETLRGSSRHKVFVQAVVEGQLPRIRNFLRMGVDLDETGTIPIKTEKMQRSWLGGKGKGSHDEPQLPIPHAVYTTYMCCCARNGDQDGVRLLLARGATDDVVDFIVDLRS